jgi:hypothetical protein
MLGDFGQVAVVFGAGSRSVVGKTYRSEPTPLLFPAGRGRDLVADRDGTIYWRSPVEDVPDFAEALSWLAYINLLEPECGCCAPCWPDAEPGPP